MHKHFCRASVAICAILVGGMARRANAQIGSYDVDKTAFYSQTSDNVPAPLNQVSATASIFTSSAGDITSADVTFPGAGSPTTLTQNGTQWTVFNPFASMAAADTGYPNGNYLFHTAGGTVGTTNHTLTLQSSYPAEPVFTGTSIHDLTTMNPNGPIHITFNGFTPDPTMNLDSLQLQLIGGPQGDQFFQPSTSATDFTLPAGTFSPATEYFLTLSYSNDNLTSTDESTYASYTDVDFTTASVPEPTGLALLGVAASLAAVLPRRRGRANQAD